MSILQAQATLRKGIDDDFNPEFIEPMTCDIGTDPASGAGACRDVKRRFSGHIRVH